VNDGTVGLRTIQSRLLVRPNARTIRWTAFCVIATVAALAVWTGGRKNGDPAVFALPVATTLLCVWLCFLFEDLAAETTDSTPTPLAWRRGVRTAIAVPAAACVWFAITWISPLEGPTAAAAGSLAAQVVLALAVAAAVGRTIAGARGGLAAAGVLVFVAIVVPLWLGSPPSIQPSRPPFGTAATYWSSLAAIGGVLLVWTHVLPRRR
jgi:hypothetical protein